MKITGKTRILFMLADPVAHVVGSHMLNQRFAEGGLDVAVSPLHVSPDDLRMVLATVRKLHNVAGFGVTIPHKIAIVPLLDHLSERARLVGSVNFVRRNADGTLLGDNIDGQGFVEGLRHGGIALQGCRVLQLGAGGAGRAVAFAIAMAGAKELVIHNRDHARAVALAADIASAGVDCTVRAGGTEVEGVDVVVNTTSQGMHAQDAPLFDYATLQGRHAVADIIMTPEITPLLAAARDKGCRLGLGKFMLQEQYPLVRRLIGLGSP